MTYLTSIYKDIIYAWAGKWYAMLNVWRFNVEIGWFWGEEESGLLQVDIMRWVYFPKRRKFTGSINLSIIAIRVFKFCLSVNYNDPY